MSTSTSISQFLALQVSGVQGVQGDRISGALAVGVAVGDARSQH